MQAKRAIGRGCRCLVAVCTDTQPGAHCAAAVARLADAVNKVTKLEFVKDLLNHLGVDLAMRCLHSELRLHSKEYAKRELTSPQLYVASILAGMRLTWELYSNLSY